MGAGKHVFRVALESGGNREGKGPDRENVGLESQLAK